MKYFVLSTLLAGVKSHGMLSYPPPRNMHSTYVHDCQGDGNNGTDLRSGTCLWFSGSCQPGCDECMLGCGVGQTAVEGPCCPGQNMLPTLDRSMWTWTEAADLYAQFNPWKSPGYAPVNDPCGAAGGADDTGLPGNGAYPPVGIEVGTPGSSLPERTDIPKTTWKAGGTAVVAFDLTANHGGGYQYRLCPKDRLSEGESCFQKTPLDYATNTHFIQFGDDWSNRVEIPAKRTTEGVFPINSTWTRLPIPACTGPFGGSAGSGCGRAKRNFEGGAPLKEMFPPVPPFKTEAGLYGFGLGSCQVDGELGDDASCTEEEYLFWKEFFAFNIVDVVKVPAGLKGEYVLSWRWDVEQTPQVWGGCSDVTIE